MRLVILYNHKFTFCDAMSLFLKTWSPVVTTSVCMVEHVLTTLVNALSTRMEYTVNMSKVRSALHSE